MGSSDIEAIVSNLRPDFPGDSYNLITQNCNSFANSLINKLLNQDIPAWVNRMAYM